MVGKLPDLRIYLPFHKSVLSNFLSGSRMQGPTDYCTSQIGTSGACQSRREGQATVMPLAINPGLGIERKHQSAVARISVTGPLESHERLAKVQYLISYKQQISTYKGWNLVRDQRVGGSNPLSPTNIFNRLHSISGPPPTALRAILRLRKPQGSPR